MVPIGGHPALPALTLIHPSDPWPLPGHPEAMKKSYRRDYFHTSAWNKNSRNFAKKVVINTAFERCTAPSVRSMVRMLLTKGRREPSLTTLLTPPHLQGRRVSL
jgi:hypothetical protein